MSNLKPKHFIPIFGASKVVQLNSGEEFILLIYNLVVITVGSILGVNLIFKYLV